MTDILDAPEEQYNQLKPAAFSWVTLGILTLVLGYSLFTLQFQEITLRYAISAGALVFTALVNYRYPPLGYYAILTLLLVGLVGGLVYSPSTLMVSIMGVPPVDLVFLLLLILHLILNRPGDSAARRGSVSTAGDPISSTLIETGITQEAPSSPPATSLQPTVEQTVHPTVARFMERFADYSDTKLKSIVQDDSLVNAAREAAHRLLQRDA